MTEKVCSLTTPDSEEEIELPLYEGSLGPMGLDISQLYNQKGIFTYDPGYVSTGSCNSKITFVDGKKGILLYRGYPVKQLAERSNFLEVAYLLLNGELPTKQLLEEFTLSINQHKMLHNDMLDFFQGFRHDTHPMAMLLAAVGSMSAYYHDTMGSNDVRAGEIFAHRIVAKIPTIAAAAYKITKKESFVQPNMSLGYCENVLHMFFSLPDKPSTIDPLAAKALDLLFILHADHEQNCSTSTVRMAGSSGTNPYSAIAAGISALWGPAHGGANEAVLKMLEEIGHSANIKKYIAKAKDRDDTFRLMGFGHRVYKNFDPRAKIIREMCHQLLQKNDNKNAPLFELALELEEVALKDEYFIEKNLYPNVDFYSGIIYRALGIPASMLTVMFAIARAVGWAAHWKEMMEDDHVRISRPRQLYTGPKKRDFVMLDERV